MGEPRTNRQAAVPPDIFEDEDDALHLELEDEAAPNGPWDMPPEDAYMDLDIPPPPPPYEEEPP